MNKSEIYLDSNIYISIAKRELDYEYTIAKMNNLKKKGIIFPHAPPHAEEIHARITGKRGMDITRRFSSLIKRFNGGCGYLPGYPNEQETIFLIQTLQSKPELQSALEIHINNLKKIQLGQIAEDEFATRVVYEDFYQCLDRVDKHIDFTDFAKRNDIFHLGRRNKKSLESNFEAINQTTESIKTFEEIQKKNNLGPRRLSDIAPDKIFDDPYFLKFVKNEFIENGINFDKIPLGSELMRSHHKKEGVITIMLNSMEKAGYSQENKNHEASLTGRMHDVSHAIYAARSKYFVTNDNRFSTKVFAVFNKLKIPTKVINTEDFLTIEFH